MIGIISIVLFLVLLLSSLLCCMVNAINIVLVFIVSLSIIITSTRSVKCHMINSGLVNSVSSDPVISNVSIITIYVSSAIIIVIVIATLEFIM